VDTKRKTKKRMRRQYPCKRPFVHVQLRRSKPGTCNTESAGHIGKHKFHGTILKFNAQRFKVSSINYNN